MRSLASGENIVFFMNIVSYISYLHVVQNEIPIGYVNLLVKVFETEIAIEMQFFVT